MIDFNLPVFMHWKMQRLNWGKSLFHDFSRSFRLTLYHVDKKEGFRNAAIYSLKYVSAFITAK